MAVSTDPLNRARIGIVSADTGQRLEAPRTNSALKLAQALGDIQPAANQLIGAIGDKAKADQEAKAQAAALEASGAPLADAVRLGTIQPTQNPWFVQAYNRESAALRGTDALNQLQTDSASWQEKTDPAAFAQKWHQSVADLTKQFAGDPDSIKGFAAAEAQATQQTLATNQAFNAQRIAAERMQNLSVLASDSLQRVVQANGGHVTGAQAAAALAPAKQQWIATGGTVEDWNKLAISAITTASYSIRSPHLLDLVKSPSVMQGRPVEGDDYQYGDGTEIGNNPQPPQPLQPVEAPPQGGPAKQQPKAPLVSSHSGQRLAMPVTGPITNTFAQHLARGSHGVDIAVPVGTRVVTPIGGRAEVGHDKKAGLFVRVVSPDGKVMSSYAHLAVAQVENGQTVAPGSVVARSGQSGDATGPHVHWRVKVDGKDVDPLAAHIGGDQQEAAAQPAAAGEAAPQLAPAPADQPLTQTTVHPAGPSLYDIAGVADTVESDRYRITQAVNSEANDRLRNILDQRKLKGLEASDRLYATFGTRILTGDVDNGTIINTLTKGGYDAATIAEALNNIHAAVADSEGLQTARLNLQSNQPGQAKALYDIATEGRVNGYTPDYEKRVGDMVMRGDIKPEEGISLVGSAVSRSESLKAEGRAQQSFDEAHPAAQPGQMIRKASQVKAGIDAYATVATARVTQIIGKSLTKGQSEFQKQTIKQLVINYLTDHPNDYNGAENLVRDYLARFLKSVAATRGQSLGSTSSPTTASAAGGNPRR